MQLNISKEWLMEKAEQEAQCPSVMVISPELRALMEEADCRPGHVTHKTQVKRAPVARAVSPDIGEAGEDW